MSFTQLTTPAVIGNSQQLQGKALLLDAEVSLSTESKASGVFCFFNQDGLEFNDVGTYEMCATVQSLCVCFSCTTR